MKTTVINFLSAILGSIAFILSIADNVAPIVGVNETLASYWAVFLAAIPSIRYTALFIGDLLDDGKINQSFVAIFLCAAAVAATFLFSGCAFTMTYTDPKGHSGTVGFSK